VLPYEHNTNVVIINDTSKSFLNFFFDNFYLIPKMTKPTTESCGFAVGDCCHSSCDVKEDATNIISFTLPTKYFMSNPKFKKHLQKTPKNIKNTHTSKMCAKNHPF